jgi:predicted anti-sigma-YlaC factor YlaD
MTDEHLHPNRGWTLIRDGEAFSPEEIVHLKDCPQCSEWISLFADLARNDSSSPSSSSPFFVSVDEHISPDRGWLLIRDSGQLTEPEVGHLYCCSVCNDWITTFTRLARKAGFRISFDIPPCDSRAS